MEQYFLECDAQTNYFTNQVVSDITHLNSLYDANFNLRIFHLNIRSIGKNLDELKVVLSSLNHTYDIIVLTETWKIVDVNSFHMSDFDIIYNNGRVNQNDGVVIYIYKIIFTLYSQNSRYGGKIQNLTIRHFL